jgi:Flp pilus assembly protein TadG
MPGRALFRRRRARLTLHGSGRFVLPPRRRPPWRRKATSAADPLGRERGQAMVEFAAVLIPLLLLVVGIIQFGLLFGANVTITNAVREAARAGTIYDFDNSQTKAWNDAQRCGDVVEAARQSLGLLSVSSPHFTTTLSGGACATPVGDGQTNGDVRVSYCDHVITPDGNCPDTTDPDTTCIPDNREGCLLRVTLTYRSDIIVPFIGALIGTDANGRFAETATATMVVN